MAVNRVSFSIASHAAWAPGVATEQSWREWARAPFAFSADAEPSVSAMPPMLRRRAGFLGKMALEVAYQVMDGRTDIPTIFCSRHGEVARSVDLLTQMLDGESLSPTGFGLAVHNASAGLFSIARKDQANHLALAAGASSVEHAVIEACSLLADGEPMVLLVSYDQALPAVFKPFEDVSEQAWAWAWLMVPAAGEVISLEWLQAEASAPEKAELPGGLDILRFQLGSDTSLQRCVGNRQWLWSRHA